MKDVNEQLVIGNVGSDPEHLQMQSGTHLANISVATNHTWKDQNNAQQGETEWHRVVCFGWLADYVHDNVARGSRVVVRGRKKTRHWLDDNGQRRSQTELKAFHFEVLNMPAREARAPQPSAYQAQASQAPRQPVHEGQCPQAPAYPDRRPQPPTYQEQGPNYQSQVPQVPRSSEQPNSASAPPSTNGWSQPQPGERRGRRQAPTRRM